MVDYYYFNKQQSSEDGLRKTEYTVHKNCHQQSMILRFKDITQEI